MRQKQKYSKNFKNIAEEKKYQDSLFNIFLLYEQYDELEKISVDAQKKMGVLADKILRLESVLDKIYPKWTTGYEVR